MMTNIYAYIIKNGIIILSIVVSILSFYFYAFNSGKESVRQEIQKEFTKQLNEELKKQKENLDIQSQLKLEASKANREIEIKYVDRVKEITKIIENKDSAINNVNCKMTQEEIDAFNNLIGAK